MHCWGDNVDWDGIDKAAMFIADNLRKVGVSVYSKEKFGTVRVYCTLENDEQRQVYRASYLEAVKKWPHLKEEILCCADYDELLGGI